MKQLASAVGLVLLMGAQWAYADAKAEAKYRHHVMEAVGGLMGSMGDIVKEDVHPEDLGDLAHAMLIMANIVPHVFPEGSMTNDSDALPEIWEDPEGFREAMQKFVKAAREMAPAAETGDMSQIGPAISALGKSCKGCHDDYKAE